VNPQNRQSPLPAAIIRVHHSGHIAQVNRQAEDVTGMSAARLKGRKAADIFQDQEQFENLLRHWSSSENSAGAIISNHPLQLRGKRKHGGRTVLVTIIPLPGSSPEAAETIVCLTDPGTSPDHGLILDSIADGIFTVDRNWIITSFNRAAELISGWSADQAVGRSCSEVFQSNICGKSCAIAESLYRGQSVANRSISMRSRSGENIPVSICASPLIDKEGKIIGGVETFRDLTILSSLRRKISRKENFDEIFSKSRTMQRLFAILPEVAESPSTVMIHGESGTGKELLARAIHSRSDRHDRPFVAINCGALPEQLLESELFGYKAGAFTDARTDKEGRFAAADGGTLFLDEIGDIPRPIQVKLLRVLQEKVYEPLGSNASVATDVRIITATNRDLEEMVRQERFREDLYYRLNVVKISLPPLRRRKEDIPLLIDQFIMEFSTLMAKDIVGISTPALNLLMAHDFPGNIRELKNIIEYAFILCEGGYIQPEHLPQPFAGGSADPGDGGPVIPEKAQTLEEIEQQAIYLSMKKHRGNQHAVCGELGISRNTLRRKMHKHGLDRLSSAGRGQEKADS
jgi:PAS domain S-box-containing protein